MNNLLPNNDLFYELDIPLNFPYIDPTPDDNNFLNTPHFHGNYEPTTDSCTTVNSSANFAFQPFSSDPFPLTPPKKDAFINWNDCHVPSLSIGSLLSEASCSFYKSVPTKANINSKYRQVVQGIFSDVTSFVLADSLNEPSIEPVQSSGVSSNEILGLEEEALMEGKIVRQEIYEQREKLLSMLQSIDDRYNQCLDEIQNITSKFNNRTSSNETGTTHAPFAHLAVSSLYKKLRERITNEIVSISQQNTTKKHENDKEREGFELSFIKQWASQQKEKIKRTESQCWRPQRGLPEKSVSVLRAWMFQNFLRPYPNDNEKDLLAVKAGLSRSQVSNWFINARVRLWKPMIEEMYAELNKMKETEDVSLIQGNNN